MNAYLKGTLLTVVFIACAGQAQSVDYLRLRNGQIVEGAVLRQDTAVVILTGWDNRNLPMPPLSVFTRDEVQSIWFVDPRLESSSHVEYSPHVGTIEFGGSVLFQTWAESELIRRDLFLLGLQAGYAITHALGIDVSADFTIPLGGAADSVWHRFDPAFQFSMSVVAQPFRWRSFVPYALAGGGAALGTPVNGTILSASKDVRSLVNAGLGIKWGLDHVGVRAEWRHHYYAWTPDAVDERGLRVAEQSADASMIRVGLFYFR
jgi:hypothetical protein